MIGRCIRLAPSVGKGVSRRRNDPQRPVYCVAEETLEELRDQPASLRLGQPRAEQCLAVFDDREDAAFPIEAGPQLRQLFIAYQRAAGIRRA